MRKGRGGVAALVAAAAALAAGAAPAGAAVTVPERFTASDGTVLAAELRTEDPAARKPVVVELGPYGRGTGTFDAGPDFHHLLVHARGTGDSTGRFDAFGPRTQQDLAEVLDAVCKRPYSSGDTGLAGFSASAIEVYQSLHLPLPCVRAAVLKSGTFELYRDLLVPGGVSNLVPGAVVVGAIGGVGMAQGRKGEPPATPLETFAGAFGTGLEVLRRPVIDEWWRARQFRGDVNRIPVLAIAGFFDVESRGAFEGFRALRDAGARLIVVGAHDAPPQGTDGGRGDVRAWFDHHLRGVDNGAQRAPRVRMLLADGDRLAYVRGRYVERTATDWPVPGTRWRPFALRAGGKLAATPAAAASRETYAALPSLPTASDVPNAAILGPGGLDALLERLPVLQDLRLGAPLGRSWTSGTLRRDLVSAGPGAVELTLATSTPGSAVWAVVSDVSPDGVAHPLTVGRLSTDFPDVDLDRSLRDPRTGDVVQPYGRFDVRRPARAGQARRYRVELWPIGNRFRKGHRVRLDLVGASLASPLSPPGVQTVTTGGPGAARLLLPVLPAETTGRKRGRGRR